MIARIAQALTKTEAHVESYVIEDTLGVMSLFFLLFLGLTISGAL